MDPGVAVLRDFQIGQGNKTLPFTRLIRQWGEQVAYGLLQNLVNFEQTPPFRVPIIDFSCMFFRAYGPVIVEFVGVVLVALGVHGLGRSAQRTHPRWQVWPRKSRRLLQPTENGSRLARPGN